MGTHDLSKSISLPSGRASVAKPNWHFQASSIAIRDVGPFASNSTVLLAAAVANLLPELPCAGIRNSFFGKTDGLAAAVHEQFCLVRQASSTAEHKDVELARAAFFGFWLVFNLSWSCLDRHDDTFDRGIPLFTAPSEGNCNRLSVRHWARRRRVEPCVPTEYGRRWGRAG